jgi:hypothetical protein
MSEVFQVICRTNEGIEKYLSGILPLISINIWAHFGAEMLKKHLQAIKLKINGLKFAIALYFCSAIIQNCFSLIQ